MRALAWLYRLILLAAAVVLALLWLRGPVPPQPTDTPAPPKGHVAIPAPGPRTPPLTEAIDRILVEKAARRLTVFRAGKPVRSYQAALGSQPLGAKRVQGDGKTPEGIYRIDRRNPASSYYLSLGVSYPQAADRKRAAALGHPPGGDIFIHGQPNELQDGLMLKGDWTAGCIALTNAEVEELWRITPAGTEIEILP